MDNKHVKIKKYLMGAKRYGVNILVSVINPSRTVYYQVLSTQGGTWHPPYKIPLNCPSILPRRISAEPQSQAQVRVNLRSFRYSSPKEHNGNKYIKHRSTMAVCHILKGHKRART